jgi:hypothetical protein
MDDLEGIEARAAQSLMARWLEAPRGSQVAVLPLESHDLSGHTIPGSLFSGATRFVARFHPFLPIAQPALPWLAEQVKQPQFNCSIVEPAACFGPQNIPITFSI